MKTLFTFLLLCTMSLYPINARAENNDDIDINPLALTSADAAEAAISASMMGWGVGIAATITIMAILIAPDGEESNVSHSHTE